MSYRFLIDECLTPLLTELAHDRGHDATSIRNMGWCGISDHDIVRRAVDRNLTVVTGNAQDFRGRAPESPGGLYAREAFHAGLIVLVSPSGPMHLGAQRQAFTFALHTLPPDLINQALEVRRTAEGHHDWILYGISADH